MSDELNSHPQSVTGRRWRFGLCEFAEFSRQLLVHGKSVKLETKPLDVLQRLLEEPTETHTKEKLLADVWVGATTTPQSLATAIL